MTHRVPGYEQALFMRLASRNARAGRPMPPVDATVEELEAELARTEPAGVGPGAPAVAAPAPRSEPDEASPDDPRDEVGSFEPPPVARRRAPAKTATARPRAPQPSAPGLFDAPRKNVGPAAVQAPGAVTDHRKDDR